MLYNLRNLQRIHGDNVILDIEHLDIEAGKVYTLIGPNGAGKTTLLNILAYVDMPTKGELHFRGQQVPFTPRSLHQLRKRVVLVDQYPLLFTGSVRKNVEYGLKVRKIERRQRLRRVDNVLEMVGMSRFAGSDARTLSGGETKRVALARALAVEPEVLLCDEPTANVDKENQEIILRILQSYNQKRNGSLLFATHSLSEASKLADHTIVLQGGRPVSARKTNIFDLRRLQEEGECEVWLIGDTLELRLPRQHGFSPGHGKIHLDPHKIGCHPLEKLNDTNFDGWAGRVILVERRDGNVRVVVDCGLDIEVMMSRETYDNNDLQIDRRVFLQIAVEPSMSFAG